MPKFGSLTNGSESQPADGSELANGIALSHNGSDESLQSYSALEEPELQSLEESDERTPDAGIHQILKNTDFWFNLELSRLEKFAVLQAGLHADAGLPRIDVASAEELPIETVLRERASELLDGWVSRVRRKVQDAIQNACAAADSCRNKISYELNQLDLLSSEIELRTNVRVLPRDGQPTPKPQTIEYEGHIRRSTYFGLITILLTVDWIANVPVLRELLPQEPQAEIYWQQLVGSSGRYGIWAGTVRLVQSILFSPDVSLLALGVILFLMALCHFFGSSLRRMVAIKTGSDVRQSLGLRSRLKQTWFPLAVSFAGIVLVITFLFVSRGKISENAEAGLANVSKQVERLEQKIAADNSSQNFTGASSLAPQLADAKSTMEVRASRAEYARRISSMNYPILLLNIVLVISAATLAYLESHATVTEKGDSPANRGDSDLNTGNQQQHASEEAKRISSLDIESQIWIAKAKYLAGLSPLRDWRGKAKRLEALVPLFRAENALRRGIDVHNIAGFKNQTPLGLPDVPEEEPFTLPETLVSCDKDLASMRLQLKAIQEKAIWTRNAGDPA